MSSGFKSLPLEFWLRVKRGSQTILFKALPWQRGTQEVRGEGSTWRSVLTPKPVDLLLHESVSVTEPLLVIMDNPECPGKVSCEDTHARPSS